MDRLTLDGLDEPGLVAQARREPEAFAELYRRHQPAVHRYALGRLSSVADAEDLTSEVFLRALCAIGRYQERGIPFRSWLLRIAANVIADLRRRRPAEDLGRHRDDLEADVAVEELAAARDQLRRIAGAAGQLPPFQRRVLGLRFGADLSHAQIGRVTGRGEGASRIGLHRALSRLRTAADLELAS